jgi:hypothetical protein
MTVGWREQLRPGVALREIVAQATASLISMDTERLEDLARCCADLNRGSIELRGLEMHGVEIHGIDGVTGDLDARYALEQAALDLKLLDRVLYETRANLTVLSRLHSIRLREIAALQTSLKHAANHALFSELSGSEDSYGDN